MRTILCLALLALLGCKTSSKEKVIDTMEIKKAFDADTSLEANVFIDIPDEPDYYTLKVTEGIAMHLSVVCEITGAINKSISKEASSDDCMVYIQPDWSAEPFTVRQGGFSRVVNKKGTYKIAKPAGSANRRVYFTKPGQAFIDKSTHEFVPLQTGPAGAVGATGN